MADSGAARKASEPEGHEQVDLGRRVLAAFVALCDLGQLWTKGVGIPHPIGLRVVTLASDLDASCSLPPVDLTPGQLRSKRYREALALRPLFDEGRLWRYALLNPSSKFSAGRFSGPSATAAALRFVLEVYQGLKKGGAVADGKIVSDRKLVVAVHFTDFGEARDRDATIRAVKREVSELDSTLRIVASPRNPQTFERETALHHAVAEPRRVATESTGSVETDEPLRSATDFIVQSRHDRILRVLKALGATRKEDSCPAGVIAAKANGKAGKRPPSGWLRKALAELRNAGFLDVSIGFDGGYWLTERGLKWLEQVA